MAKRDKTYIRPMLEVYQMLDDTVGVVGEHLTACVIGPQYDLYRYGLEELKPHLYSGDGVSIPFDYDKDPAFDYSVDQSFVSVYGENLEATMYSGDASGLNNTLPVGSSFSAGSCQVAAGGTYCNELRLSKATTSTGDTPQVIFAGDDVDSYSFTGENVLLTAAGGYCVEEADMIQVTDTEGDVRSAFVKELLGTPIASSVTAGTAVAPRGTGTTSAIKITGSDANLTVDGSSNYTGKKNTTVVVKVTGVEVTSTKKTINISVTDTESILAAKAAVISLTSATGDGVTVDCGRGIKLKFAAALYSAITGSATVQVGDTFTFVAVSESASTTEFNGVELTAPVLNIAKVGEAGYGINSLRIVKLFSDELPVDSYTISEDKVTVGRDLGLDVVQTIKGVSRTYHARFRDNAGSLYASFRVLVIPGHDEDIYEIAELSDITRYFGTIDQDNLLAYGCYRAFMGAAKRMIYAIRTRGTGKDEFYDAVKKTEANRAVYSFCPLTHDYAVAEVVAKFNDEMSEPEVKRWRRTIVGIEDAGSYLVASKAKSTSGVLEDIKATITKRDDGTAVVQLDESIVFDLRQISVNDSYTALKRGDLVRVAVTGDYFAVKEVVSDKVVILQSSPSSNISTLTPIELYKAATPENNVEYIGMTASSFANRRALLVWTDHGTLADNGLVVPVANMFLAAEVAGLSSAVLPQASITHTEITGITAAPRMYTQYSQKQLDEIASYGVLVITQDAKDDPCYIRHQLTTDMAHGVLYREDSCTRNLDNISYAMVDILEKYIGHANVTPSALAAIRDDVTARLNEFTTDGTDPMIGPSLVSWDNLRVKQDKVFKDRVNIWVDLYLPLPLNNIRLYEMAYAATVEI